MLRLAGAVSGGLATWIVLVTLLNFGLRAAMPGYHAAEPMFAFTLSMMIGRLVIAVLTSLAAGAVVRAIAPGSQFAPWVVGIVLLALFIPVHVQIGARLPLWYHMAFLLTLAPLIWVGARLGQRAVRD
ncbi:hypothetical protein [Novosphingobium sp.]|uniref:hypothetical protein n=1 Tax=Novosphingobium sp. TaxID=1874826 RepID=UPI0025F4665E|nr:hypothetical protein [Novosphingobium sp.]